MPLASAAGLHRLDRGLDERRPASTGCTSSRSLPEMMRLMSSRSSISCVCTRALRSIVSSPFGELGLVVGAAPQDLRPAEDRVERRAQLVRQRREELVLHLAHALGLGARGALALEQLLALLGRLLRRFVQPRVVDRDAGLRGDADDEPLGALGEHAGVRVAEEQPADHLAGARDRPARRGSCAPAGGPCGMPWCGAIVP